MQMYNATVEVAVKGDYDTDVVLSRLEGWHASVGNSERGWASATISLPGESLPQATAAASAVVSSAFGGEAIVAEVMTEAEFDAREGWQPVPDLVSVSEAAALLGVSRQRVLQRIEERSLPARKVGRDYVIALSAIGR